MRIGLIGLGRIGAFHAATLAHLSIVDTLVVADAVPAAIEKVVATLGATPADSVEELLAAVDGVVVAASTDAHPKLILAAVEAGVPVFCEKPVARAAAEAADVLRRAEELAEREEATRRMIRAGRTVDELLAEFGRL